MRQVWHYLLEKTLMGAVLLLWGIAFVVYAITMGALYYILKR